MATSISQNHPTHPLTEFENKQVKAMMAPHPPFSLEAESQLQRARDHGRMTHSELNALLPTRMLTSNEIESIFEFLATQGICVVDD